MSKNTRLLQSSRVGFNQIPLDSLLVLRSQVLSTDMWNHEAFDGLLQKLLTEVNRELNVEFLSLLLYDGIHQRLRLTAISRMVDVDNLGDFETLTHSARKLRQNKDDFNIRSFRDKKTIVCNRLHRSPNANFRNLEFWSDRSSFGRIGNAIFIPFFSSLECSGVIRVFNRLGSDGGICDAGFSRADQELLEQIAQLIGTCVGLLWEKHQLHYLKEMFSQLSRHTNLKELFIEIAKVAATLANSSAAALYIIDVTDPTHLRLAGSWGFTRPYRRLTSFPIKGSRAGQVATSGDSDIILDVAKADGVANREIALIEKIQSCAVVPAWGLTTKGSLAVYTRDTRRFQQDTIEVLESLGSFVGNLLQSWDESIQKEKSRRVLQWVGHSLRGPLAGIARAADDLKHYISHLPNAKEALSSVDVICAEKDRTDRRAESLLFAKKGILEVMALERKRASIPTLINSCVHRHSFAAAKRGIKTVIYDSAKNLPEIVCDPEKIDLVLDNILENAIKYSWKNQVIEIRGWSSKTKVQVSFMDRGLGIPQRLLGSIFEAFSRSDILDTTRYIKGTGLGLELVKTVVEAHKGQVEVKSHPFLSDPERIGKFDGYETTFTITLPRS